MDLIHESTGICACIQDKNTDRYKQICTECRSAYVHVFRIRSAYLHVFRIKIQTDTYRYALNAGVHIRMYSGQQYRQIHADMNSPHECISVCICLYVG